MANPVADFPAALHTPIDITAFTGDPLGATSPDHIDIHGKIESELLATQSKIGIGASVPDENYLLVGQSGGDSLWMSPAEARVAIGLMGGLAFFNVEDYGAVGDDSTDDTAAVNAAIAAAVAAGGGEVYFPGLCVVTDEIELFTNITVRGNGMEFTGIRQTTLNKRGFFADDASSIGMMDIMVRGNGTGTNVGSGTGIGVELTWTAAGNNPFHFFKNVMIRNWGDVGLRMQTPIVSSFEKVYMAYNATHGMEMWDGGTSCTFISCWARQNGSAGYKWDSSVYQSLNGCAADNNGTNYMILNAQSIFFNGCGSEGALLNGGLFDGFGFYVDNSSVINIEGWVTDNRNIGVWVTNGSNAISIRLADNSPNGSAVNFIKVDSGCNATIYELHNSTANDLAVGTTTVINDGAGGSIMQALYLNDTNGQLAFTAETDGGDFNISSSNGAQILAIYGAGGGNSLSLQLLDGDFIMDTNTASRAAYFDADKKLKTSAVTSTELGYLSGVTSNIQDQIDGISAGATAWGAITGTLSDQTDLQSALDAKQAADAFLDDIAALTDPGADRLLFWDDSAGEITWLTLGTGLSITGTTINASGSGVTFGTVGQVPYSNAGGTDFDYGEVQITATAMSPVASDGNALGTSSLMWSDLFLASGAVINFNNGDVTLTHSADTLTLGGGNLALGANNLTMTGSIGATGARVTKGWFTDIESTNMPTVGGTVLLTSLTAPQFTTIELGHASDTTLSRVSAGVLAVEGVTVATASNSLTLTNKTLTSPVVGGTPVMSAGANTVLTVPTVDGTATGEITNGFNAGYTTVLGDIVYLDSSGTWQKADADASATTYSGMLGMVLTGGITSGNVVPVLLRGFAYMATAFPTFTVGGLVYLSATDGAVTQTAPSATDSATRVLGWGVHADKMWFDPSPDYIVHT